MARQCAHLLYDRAARIRQAAHLWYSGATQARQCLHLRYSGATQARQCLHLRYSGTSPARQCLHMIYGPTPQARQCLHMRYTGESSGAAETTVTISGQPVSPVSISISEDSDQVAVTATLEFARPLPDAQAESGAAVNIDIWAMSYFLQVESYSRSRSFGAHTWTLTASSPAARLQSRYADPVEGELSGRASHIAARLAGNVPLHWDMVDWDVQPMRLVASGEAPLDLLRTLATAAGGAVTSLPDGSLHVVADPPYPPADWPARAALTVDSLHAMISVSDNDEPREPYNAVTVSDERESSEGLRIEEDNEARRGSVTEARVYQVPWQDNFDARHCGRPEIVVLEDLGIEERIIEDEQIEVVDGQGRTQYPIHAVISGRWNAVNLGGITPSEDGTITTATPGESILYLTYKTKARRYRVDLGEENAPPLMLVVED